MAEMNKANILGLIGLLGAIMMIVGVFLSWADSSIVIMDKVIWEESYSGWDIYSEDEFSDFAYNYVPLVALIAGVVAILTTIIPAVLHMDNIGKILGLVSLILAIVTIVLVVVYNGDIGAYNIDIPDFSSSAGTSTGMGAWISLAGGALLAIGGIIDIIAKTTGKIKTE